MPLHKLFPGPECLAGLAENLRIELVLPPQREAPAHPSRASQARHFGRAAQGYGPRRPEPGRTPIPIRDGGRRALRRSRTGERHADPGPSSPGRARQGPGRKTDHLSGATEPSTPFIEPDDHREKERRPGGARMSTSASGLRRRERDRPQHPAGSRKVVERGGYRALHFIDHTADGWVEAVCPQLDGPALNLQGKHAAYSLVTAPDFFPTCDQREMTEWAATLPSSLRDSVWQVNPVNLSEQRLPANLQLPGGKFDPADTTMAAIVPLLRKVPGGQTRPRSVDSLRHSPLPDDSAGVFDPGWDVARDVTNNTLHMAAYGLGAPSRRTPSSAPPSAPSGPPWRRTPRGPWSLARTSGIRSRSAP